MKMLIDLSLGEVYGPSVMGEASPAGGVAWVNHGKPIINQTVRNHWNSWAYGLLKSTLFLYLILLNRIVWNGETLQLQALGFC